MNKQRNLIIFGSALGLAAIAIAIDHTKHPLPDPIAAKHQSRSLDAGGQSGGSSDLAESPCGLDGAPCGMDDNPCSLE